MHSRRSSETKANIMNKKDKTEVIVVFKKEIEISNAESILESAGTKYRKGMDSSRGKIYFYSTGPKFILTFDTKRARELFISAFKDRKEIHEVYIPDWNITKD